MKIQIKKYVLELNFKLHCKFNSYALGFHINCNFYKEFFSILLASNFIFFGFEIIIYEK